MRIRKQVGDAGKGRTDQHAAADALQRARRHQERHVRRHAAQRRGHREHHDRCQHERLASVVVAQPAEYRHGNHRGQQVGRGDPRVVFEPLQLRHHRGQRRPDHGLVQRHQHHHEGHAQHGQQRLAKRQDLAARLRTLWFGGHFIAQSIVALSRIIGQLLRPCLAISGTVVMPAPGGMSGRKPRYTNKVAQAQAINRIPESRRHPRQHVRRATHSLVMGPPMRHCDKISRPAAARRGAAVDRRRGPQAPADYSG
ncbi:hypothetical protein CBM2637_B120156 [Cupriavidus taiwanensis]|nr:hypothetical protein CBM2637_B120156 [Cupriavidus taiwanensis]